MPPFNILAFAKLQTLAFGGGAFSRTPTMLIEKFKKHFLSGASSLWGNQVI